MLVSIKVAARELGVWPETLRRWEAPAQSASGAAVGLDAGVTEVLAASNGEKYGQRYGALLAKSSC